MRPAAMFLLLLSLAAPVAAQDPAPAPAAPQETTIDATKLGVSLSRIQKGLRIQQGTETQSGSPLRLVFQVQVYGAAPRIDVLKGFDLLHGAVPGSAPSHQQMVDFWTPQAFSAPTVPFGAMAFWAIDQLSKKSKRSACEEEIANYKATLMQGISIAAPRCAQ
jgi:hypothetical protein